jgi:hypothetical protein
LSDVLPPKAFETYEIDPVGVIDTRNLMVLLQCGEPFFSNTRQNGEWTETITRQDEKELAMFGE